MGRTIRWVQTSIRLAQGPHQWFIFGIGLHNCLHVLNRLRS